MHVAFDALVIGVPCAYHCIAFFLQEQGFRVFASVGISSYSKIKTDICAVICDRLHPDGTTLRGSDKVIGWYSQFYDARDIIDLDVRPNRGVKWTPKSAS